MGVSENRGPQYRTLNSTLIFGESHMGLRALKEAGLGF